MRKIWISMILLLLLCALPVTAYAQEYLVPVGEVVGLQLRDGTVSVADVTPGSAGEKAGLQPGDCILRLDGQAITTPEQLKTTLKNCGKTAKLDLLRGGKAITLTVTPEETAQGPHLGIYLRSGITGIGTITYYDPETGVFGTLGHGVNDPAGALTQMESGSAYPARVQSVRRGRTGNPGQLVGAIRDAESLGSLYRNTSQGLFGKTSQALPGEALPVASAKEVRTGKATILSTIQGSQPQEYSVEILKIYAKERQGGRNLLIKITDSRLLEATGGIVQGMSGSPIIQNGKLVGAVTHVLVNDPARGYGIAIEKMLDMAA